MRDKIAYEWDVETVEISSGDIVDHDFQPSYAACCSKVVKSPPEDGHEYQIVLVRDVGNDIDGLVERSWAYIDECGFLPENFEGGCTEPVPQRFVAEVKREINKDVKALSVGLRY